MVSCRHAPEIVFLRLAERTTRMGVPSSSTYSMVDGWVRMLVSFPPLPGAAARARSAGALSRSGVWIAGAARASGATMGGCRAPATRIRAGAAVPPQGATS